MPDHRHHKSLFLSIGESGLRNQGQSLSEYSLVFGLVIIVTIGALVLVGGNLSGRWEQNSTALFGNETNTQRTLGKLPGVLSTQANPNIVKSNQATQQILSQTATSNWQNN